MIIQWSKHGLVLSLILLASCSDKNQPAEDEKIVVTGQATSRRPAGPAPHETLGQEFLSNVIGSFDFTMASTRFAAERGEPAKVKDYARKLASDVAAARAELEAIAAAGRLQLTPTPGPTHESDLAILSSTRGTPLSRAFAEQQMEALTLLVGTMRAYKNGGDNPRLRAWAEKHQSVMNDRLLDAQTLRAELETAALPADQR